MAHGTDRSKEWPHEVFDWHEEVSRIELQSIEGDCIVFVLDAFRIGIPNQILEISLKHSATGLTFGLDEKGMEKLAKWLLTAKYLTRYLRQRKDEEARRLSAEYRLEKHRANDRAKHEVDERIPGEDAQEAQKVLRRMVADLQRSNREQQKQSGSRTHGRRR